MYTAQGEYICTKIATNKKLYENFLVDDKPNESSSLIEREKSCQIICNTNNNEKLTYEQIKSKKQCIKDKMCN
jgi:hypothetical protein